MHSTTSPISTVLKGRSARKKQLLRIAIKKIKLRLATAHKDKDLTFRKKVLWSDVTKQLTPTISN